jgi:hypothetical protein
VLTAQRRRGALRRALALFAAAAAGLGLALVPASPAQAAVPGAPTLLLAIASDHSVRLGWYRPDDDGGQQITSYKVTASTGQQFTATQAPATLAGLPDDVSVRFRVAAVNADGTGPVSAWSNTVTPRHATSTNTWAATGSMLHARYSAEAVRLANGKVFVVGGFPSGFDAGPLTTAELYNPATGHWSATSSIDQPRNAFTLTLLPNGRALLVGGADTAFHPMATARVYNPATGTWSATGSLHYARALHTATLLPSGKVLVTGGVSATAARASAELYSPSTGQWTPARSLHAARYGHSATLRTDGRVVVTGGSAGSAGLRSTEVYVPSTNTWVLAGPMTTAREDDEVCCHGAAPLPGARVLAAGGHDAGTILASAEVYASATGTWSGTGSMRVARDSGFGLLPLANGRILAAAGRDFYGALKYAETYQASTGRWSRINDMGRARVAPVAVVLANGKVLVAGGADGLIALGTAEVLTPAP